MVMVEPERVVQIARPEVPKICIILCDGAGDEEVVSGFDLTFKDFSEAYKYFEGLKQMIKAKEIKVETQGS